MTLALTPPEWMDDALCAQTDPEVLFPEKGGQGANTAKRICALCPAKAACLDYALAEPSLLGVWGGTSERQRIKMRAAARKGITEPAPKPKPKPTKSQVSPELRARVEAPLDEGDRSYRQIGRALGVSHTTVVRVAKGRAA